MFTLRTAAAFRSFSPRVFSTTKRHASDLCRLTLIGYLARDPENKLTRNDKEYISYTVSTKATQPPDANGERQPPKYTYHRILSFSEFAIKFLSTLKKGSRVYVEANYEMREPEAGTDPTTPQGQRQIFLRHEVLKVISYPPKEETPSENEVESESEDSLPFPST